MRRHAVVLSILSSFVLRAGAGAQCVSDTLLPNDPAASGLFGTAVRTRGDFAIIGATGVDAPGAADNGAAYIFSRSGLAWTQVQKLLPADLDASKRFGASVSIDGDYAAVASPDDTYGGFNQLGSVYIYHRVGGSWVQEFNVLCPAANRASFNRFGYDIALDGDTLAIGAPYEGSSRGAAYVFTRSGTTWSLQQRIQPAGMPGTAFFGLSLDVEGDTVVAGASGDNSAFGNATGAAYVYSRAAGAWTLRSKIAGSTAPSSSQFGRSVSLSAARIVAAAPFKESGAAYVFRQLDINTWIQEGGAIMSPDAPAATIYAQDVSMDETANRLVISGNSSGAGGPAVTDLYQRLNGAWQFINRRTQEAASAQYGNAISYEDGVLLVGAMSAEPTGVANSGAAHAYVLQSNQSDLCANAVLTQQGTHFGCTSGMQANGDSALLNDNTGPDVYYRFSPVCTGRFYITTDGSTFDTILSIHSACGATVNNTIAANDDISAANRNSALHVDVARGENTYIRVGGFGGQHGAFRLSISDSVPLNDYCLNAQTIDPGQTSFGTCLTVTDGASFTGCGSAGMNIHNDVWFRFTAACTGRASVDTCLSPHTWDSVLAVFAADSCSEINSGALVACNDDSCSLLSGATFQATAGQTYYIRAGGANSAVRGSGVLRLTLDVSCPADYNQDGGIDGSDVQAFFGDWESGLIASDVNCDGGIDGADVEVFFAAWEGGGC